MVQKSILRTLRLVHTLRRSKTLWTHNVRDRTRIELRQTHAVYGEEWTCYAGWWSTTLWISLQGDKIRIWRAESADILRLWLSDVMWTPQDGANVTILYEQWKHTASILTTTQWLEKSTFLPGNKITEIKRQICKEYTMITISMKSSTTVETDTL